ncbi:MAG: L,D-transpeptidase family protein [Gammaproteobacteria bacterium]|nr:L,D-transpeptidase family protein [Gammaproteobacteria bacterium]
MRSTLSAIASLLIALPVGAAEEGIPLALIDHFETARVYGRLEVRGVAIPDHQELAEFYEDRRFQPIWVSSRGEKRRAAGLRRSIAEGAIHGLDVRRYHLVEADVAAAADAWADVELLLSQALLAQARHRTLGVVDPARVDPSWLLRRAPLNGGGLLRAVARGGRPTRALNRLWPESKDYWRLLAAKQRLRAASSMPEPATIAAGPILKPGMEDPRVPALRERVLGVGSADLLYDANLADAVIAYQRRARLEHDGIVGPDTRAMLNRSRAERSRQIDANLERWRWLPRAFPSTYVLVNTADFRLVGVRRGRREVEMPVIVGTPFRQTPVFTETMKYLVFNPAWDVPRTLAVEDLLPKLKNDPARLAADGFEAALAGGEMQPVDSVDWSDFNADWFPYHLRQRPGPGNPLGRIKFMLPNEYAIYLHDTPAQGLFERTERGFSSGCIRVADAMVLAEWVLKGQLTKEKQPWNRAMLDTAVKSTDTRAVVLDAQMPVFIVYFTAHVALSGDVVVKNDVYERDAPVIAALDFQGRSSKESN